MKRIFFARSADAQNFNAQAKNIQNILRYWSSEEFRPAVVSFREPDADVAANPNVDLRRVRPDHFWTARWFAQYMGNFDAVFCPGLHHTADWLALRLLSLVGRRPRVIATLEGLVGSLEDQSRETQYSDVVGHAVFCQKISPAHLHRIESMYQMAEHIIAINPLVARIGAVRYGPKISMLPFGFDPSFFQDAQRHHNTRPRVVSAGRVSAHKRPNIFVTLAAAFQQADFVWFGEGEMRANLLAEIRRLGLTNIDFPGPLQPPILAREFAGSDIFLMPSLSEGGPRVSQEAAAAGLAQVVFGFYEGLFVVDGHNGFVVWSDDECKARLGQLLESPDLVERMGREGSAMSGQWVWKTVAPQWEQRIVDVLSSRLKPI